MAASPPQQEGVFGQEQQASGNSDFNALSFLVKQMLGQISVATLVRVDAVNTTGRVAPVGTVDITPLVNQRDGSGALIPHTTINDVPFLRIQGGTNAIICDPKVGDVGFCVFADRDISSVKATLGQAAPGSLRRFDYADALYIGGWLSTTEPEHYFVVDDAGIKIEGGPQIDIHGDEMNITMDDLTISAINSITINAPQVTVSCTTATVTCAATAVVNATASIALNAPLVTANGMSIV